MGIKFFLKKAHKQPPIPLRGGKQTMNWQSLEAWEGLGFQHRPRPPPVPLQFYNWGLVIL